MKLWLEVIRRFAAISSVVLWLGGFTFYAGVVIPTGARVLRSHRVQGLITQQVTDWLNLIGIIALLVLLWNAIATRRGGRWAYRIVLATWVVMAILQVALLVLHPMMDRLIDVPTRRLLDADRFDSLHSVYGALATVQWGCGVLHVLALVYAWTAMNANGNRSQDNPAGA